MGDGARFDWDVGFSGVTFGGPARFNGTTFRSECRLESLKQTDDPQVGRTFSFHNTRFRAGIIADLPAGRVLAQGVEFGAPSRLAVRGPISLNRTTLNHPLSLVTTNREEVGRLVAAGCTPDVATLSGATLQAPLILGDPVVGEPLPLPPETAGITTGGEAVLLALRFISPVLLALTFLSIRSRVHR